MEVGIWMFEVGTNSVKAVFLLLNMLLLTIYLTMICLPAEGYT